MEDAKLKSWVEGSGKTISALEDELKMPRGTLSKAISGSRALPKKFAGLVGKEAPIVKAPAPAPAPDGGVSVLPAWAKEIEKFCSDNNCTPDDLMKNFEGKKPVKRPAKIEGVGGESFFERRQREARGE